MVQVLQTSVKYGFASKYSCVFSKLKVWIVSAIQYYILPYVQVPIIVALEISM